MSKNPLSGLAEISVVKLNFGSAAMCREIERAGYSNLELFSLCDDEIDLAFDFNEADEVIALKNHFQSDPKQVAKSFLHMPEIDRERVDAIIKLATLC